MSQVLSQPKTRDYTNDPVATVLPRQVAEWARVRPDHTFLQQVEGGSLTYSQAHASALTWADALHRLGVAKDDIVLAMRRPTIDGICFWLGTAWAGGIETSINTDYRG